MPSLSPRKTSADFYAEYTPSGVAAAHIQKLIFASGVTGGTFKLEVNGEKTAAITFSATPATLISAINTALDATTLLAPSAIVASGTAVSDITLTAATSKFYVIRTVDIALTPATVVSPLLTEVTTQGSEVFIISADAGSFEYSGETTMIDVTGLSEHAKREVPVEESVSFSLTLYDANQTWLIALSSEFPYGKFSIWEQGKFVGRPYLEFNAHIASFGKSFPTKEKIEITIDGARYGDWVTPPHSIYRG